MGIEIFKKWFEDEVGADFSIFPIPELDLYPVFGERGLLYGSQAAVKKPVLIQNDFSSFEESVLDHNFFQIGFWGHGCNSYAIYYVRVDAWSTVAFRLLCGGMYSDFEKDSKNITKFLETYFLFEKKAEKVVRRLTAISWAGINQFTVIDADGKEKSDEGYHLFLTPDFENQLE